MKAMILSAGLGTRLQPYTNNKPKALVEVNGIPMLEILIKKLIRSGITEIIINVHHFAEQIISFLENRKKFGIRIEISYEKQQILNTGGGLKKASWFFDDDEPFLLHNVDVLSNIDIKELLNFHNKKSALTTLAVKNRETSRYLLFNEDMTLCGWEQKLELNKRNFIISRKEKPLNSFAFSGIHIIEPVIFDLIKQKGDFSIIDTYLDLSKNYNISGFLHDKDFWIDLGKPESIEIADSYLLRNDSVKSYKGFTKLF